MAAPSVRSRKEQQLVIRQWREPRRPIEQPLSRVKERRDDRPRELADAEYEPRGNEAHAVRGDEREARLVGTRNPFLESQIGRGATEETDGSARARARVPWGGPTARRSQSRARATVDRGTRPTST